LKVIADLHIHSRYSRATSQRMCIEEIARFAKIKGLNLVGTGDFTHPEWLREIEKTLVPEQGTGLYSVAGKEDSSMRFMLTTEVCTIFEFESAVKKVHHVILTTSVETAVQVNEALKRYGDLAADGRPLLDMTAPQLVEEVMAVSDDNMVFPAHIWTPWFSVFGAFSGFDSIEECYQDMTKYIHALETGLSSDPAMNWRLSRLDRFALVSNSDCHSFWPWRIGREANVLELPRISYREVVNAICSKDPAHFKLTIETDPAYGKYHWTGHRKCNVSLSPQESEKFGNICPVCRRKLTKGVEHRIEELADRPADFKPDNVPDFMRLLPLSEIIATVLGTSSPSTQAVWKIYNLLVDRFGDEYKVLIDAPEDALAEVVDTAIAEAVVKVRNGAVRVVPGYDGVYGKLALGVAGRAEQTGRRRVKQLNLEKFW
jgi:uncharacterized protein (TIGR00375 family)